MAVVRKQFNNALGKQGETCAAAWLQRQHFDILFCNYKVGRWEIDVVAVSKNILCLIEVKTRRSDQFGWPEACITKNKWRQMKSIGELLLEQYPQYAQAQIHVLSIIITGQDREFFFEGVG